VTGTSRQLRRLESLGRRRADMESAVAEAVAAARAAGGSWSAVGAALGVSAQAAQQRYGRRSHQPRAATGRAVTAPHKAAQRLSITTNLAEARASGNGKANQQPRSTNNTVHQGRLTTSPRRASAGRAGTHKEKRP
jgi:hypothetical protein